MIFSFLKQSSWQKFDWVLALSAIVLTCIGFAAIYSVDLSRGESLIYIPRQLLACVIGMGIFLIASHVHITLYENNARAMYVLALLLLVAVLFFGVTIRGTTGWFRIFGFSFQPAEIAKVALVLFLAWRVERQARRFEQWQFVVATMVVTLILAGLIMMQPDLGSALVLVSMWFAVISFVGTKKRYIVGLIIIGIITIVVAWFGLFEVYQKERVLTFLNPERDPLGSGYNVSQSIIAIGAGNIWGRGLGFGSQSQLHFLPEAQTDFIFSVIGEELGFVGTSLVLILYFIILWRLALIASHARSDFSTYTAFGILCIFFFHVIINIGAVIGLLPVTGITLPFLSYGGSSLIINFFLIGIAESVARSL